MVNGVSSLRLWKRCNWYIETHGSCDHFLEGHPSNIDVFVFLCFHPFHAAPNKHPKGGRSKVAHHRVRTKTTKKRHSFRTNNSITRWWFQSFFIFTPDPSGNDFQFDVRIFFQRGWEKNHQLDNHGTAKSHKYRGTPRGFSGTRIGLLFMGFIDGGPILAVLAKTKVIP